MDQSSLFSLSTILDLIARKRLPARTIHGALWAVPGIASLRPLLASLLTCLQPIGIAVAQVLSYAATNASELALEDALATLGIATIATLVIWLLIWATFARARPAALIVSLLAFSFWAYAHVLDFALARFADSRHELPEF